jgi:hypothetical protein
MLCKVRASTAKNMKQRQVMDTCSQFSEWEVNKQLVFREARRPLYSCNMAYLCHPTNGLPTQSTKHLLMFLPIRASTSGSVTTVATNLPVDTDLWTQTLRHSSSSISASLRMEDLTCQLWLTKFSKWEVDLRFLTSVIRKDVLKCSQHLSIMKTTLLVESISTQLLRQLYNWRVFRNPM